MLKVFVSQPHKGRTDEELDACSTDILEKLRLSLSDEDIREIPMLKPEQFKGQHPVYYLGMNLQMLCQADLVVFAPGWWESRACCIEKEVCDQYGIKTVEMTMISLTTDRNRKEQS